MPGTVTEVLHATRLAIDTDTDPSPIVTAARQTITDGNFAARLTDSLACGGVIVTGAPGCIIEGQLAARVGDLISHGSIVMTGSPKVVIGNVGGGAIQNGTVIGTHLPITPHNASERTLQEFTQEAAIKKKMQELASQGHGPQRHGPQLTEKQLDDRAMFGIDPVTGTKKDAFKKFPDGMPKDHKAGKHATKIVSNEKYTAAEEFIRKSQEFNQAVGEAVVAFDSRITVEISLENIFGPDYKNYVFGKTRVGSSKHPTGTIETDFTDGVMVAVYDKDSDDNWNLTTMYPEPNL